MCVFGSSRKLGQTEFIFRVDCKIPYLTRNSFSGFILPSNDFHPRKIEERERERNSKEISPEACLVAPRIDPNPRSHRQREREADHLNLISTAPPSGPCLPHHRSLAIIDPPLPYHRSTNTQDLPLRS